MGLYFNHTCQNNRFGYAVQDWLSDFHMSFVWHAPKFDGLSSSIHLIPWCNGKYLGAHPPCSATLSPVIAQIPNHCGFSSPQSGRLNQLSPGSSPPKIVQKLGSPPKNNQLGNKRWTSVPWALENPGVSPRFFLGLIVCSKGTVSEKAMALFHLFSYAGPEPKPGTKLFELHDFEEKLLERSNVCIYTYKSTLKYQYYTHTHIYIYIYLCMCLGGNPFLSMIFHDKMWSDTIGIIS